MVSTKIVTLISQLIEIGEVMGCKDITKGQILIVEAQDRALQLQREVMELLRENTRLRVRAVEPKI